MARPRGAKNRVTSGLLVKHSSTERRRGGDKELLPPGWFICVQGWSGGRRVWESIEQLRFVRQRDADLAANALRLAGIDSRRAMVKAGGETVLRTAFEALQW